MNVPTTLNEALSDLGQLSLDNKSDFDEMISGTEDSFNAMCHFGIGMWIRNNWGLWKEEGPLYEYFKSIGINHPDDMSGIIFTTFYRRFHKLDEDVPGQVQYYKDFWAKQKDDEGVVWQVDLKQ